MSTGTSIDVVDPTGKKTAKVDLDEAVFGIEPNVAVMHQVVTAQLAARRAGTQNTKTRSEVAGGGAKPWKQKGTGRSRQGSIRSPQWRGGGVALGPKPRSYAQRTPKKMVSLALRSALSDRAADGRVKVVEFGWDAPKTSQATKALADLKVDGRALVVVSPGATAVWKSFRNLSHVHVVTAAELNAYDVLVADWIVFTPDTIPQPKTISRGGPSSKDFGEGTAAQAPAGAASDDDTRVGEAEPEEASSEQEAGTPSDDEGKET